MYNSIVAYAKRNCATLPQLNLSWSINWPETVFLLHALHTILEWARSCKTGLHCPKDGSAILWWSTLHFSGSVAKTKRNETKILWTNPENHERTELLQIFDKHLPASQYLIPPRGQDNNLFEAAHRANSGFSETFSTCVRWWFHELSASSESGIEIWDPHMVKRCPSCLHPCPVEANSQAPTEVAAECQAYTISPISWAPYALQEHSGHIPRSRYNQGLTSITLGRL